MYEVKALVTEIERSSLEDGPGLRTVVFFKGCPLNCKWCHNPECISFEKQIMFYPEKCIGCKKCNEGCFSGAKVICGKEMTAEEIFSKILEDKNYYGQDGGVTFSGGEPMAKSEMLKALIKLCRENGINTCIETSLCIFDEEILSELDYIIADFKIFNADKHKEYTGVSNEIIKENFFRLDKLNVPFEVHTPVIKGINDTKEEITNIRNFIADFKNIKKYKLLPYHSLGVSKQKALGMEEIRFETPADEVMKELEKYAQL